MSPDYLTSTAIHEAAHATISYLLGEHFQYIELLGDRDGYVMPFHSPCPICGANVASGEPCQECFDHYAHNDPMVDARSRSIERAYRLEAAVAAAGELAEAQSNNGVLLASEEELKIDRLRVSTRSSLRHLYSKDACTGYVGGGGPSAQLVQSRPLNCVITCGNCLTDDLFGLPSKRSPGV